VNGHRRGWVAAGLCALVLAAVVPGVASAGPAIDPRRMSGIPRPDPALSAGTVTVRCLLGGFDAPAVGVEVTLEIDGAPKVTRTAETDAAGRATFEGLADLVGRKAVARATLGGVEVTSRPFSLRADAGTRLLLVAGASGASHARPDKIPAPGEPFDLEGRPAGTLVVGTLDLRKDARGRAEGRTVTVRIRHPDGRETVRTGVSDAEGRATFEGLAPPDVPEDATIVVEAQIAEDGPPQRSQPFRMGATAKALYLAEGFEAAEGHGAGRRPTPPVEPPRLDPGLPEGVVRVEVRDGEGRPVPGLSVSVFKKDRAGNDVEVRGRTGDDGVARVEGVPVQEDALYFVGAVYGGGPYQSGFFRMEEGRGVRLGLVVYETTSDPAVVRSAVQFEVLPRENDMAQVVQVYQVFVDGDRAFWPEGGRLRIEAPEGARSVTVLPSAGRFLEQPEDAPFADAAGPIPPGEIADLSIAYLLPHDGTLDVSWTPPFGVLEASVVLRDPLTLEAPNVEKTTPSHPDPQRPVGLYKLGQRPPGADVHFVVGGLPTRPKVWRTIAWSGASLLLLGVVLGIARGRRRDLRLELLAQREALARRYLATDDPHERREILVMIDRIARTLDELDAAAQPARATSDEPPDRPGGARDEGRAAPQDAPVGEAATTAGAPQDASGRALEAAPDEAAAASEQPSGVDASTETPEAGDSPAEG